MLLEATVTKFSREVASAEEAVTGTLSVSAISLLLPFLRRIVFVECC